MDATFDETTAALLGKCLLGQATEDERRDLESRRRASAALAEAMDLLDRSRADYRRSAAGEERPADAAGIPDYLRPQRLAQGLEGWYWRWLAATVVSAAVVLGMTYASVEMQFPAEDAGRTARHFFVPAGCVLAAAAVAGWAAKDRLVARVVAGGLPWERAVGDVRRQERFLSPLAHTVMLVAAAAAAGLTIAAVEISGRSGGRLLLLAVVAQVVALRIAKRRFLLRGLRGPGGLPE